MRVTSYHVAIAFTLLFVIAGIYAIAMAPVFEGPIKGVMVIVGIILLGVGGAFYGKARDHAPRGSRKRRVVTVVLALIVASTILSIITPVFTQSQSEQYCDTVSCPKWRQSILGLEGFIVFLTGLTAIVGVGAFILPIFRELIGGLANMFLPALGALIIITLFIVPLHVVFVPCTTTGSTTGGGNNNGGSWGAPLAVYPHKAQPPVLLQNENNTVEGCYVDTRVLETSGPPLLQKIYSLIQPG